MKDRPAPNDRASAGPLRVPGPPLLGLVAALVLALLSGAVHPTAAHDMTADPADPLDQFAGVELPGGMGETDMQVYVEATGHTIRNTMLDYWRATGAAATYGNPISEPFPSADGFYSQAFENAVFHYRPEFFRTNDPTMRLMPIGNDALRDRLGGFRRDGRRDAGGGDRRADAWRPLNPSGTTVARALERGGAFVEATRHTLTGAFLDWYERHEGALYLGNPLGERLRERGMTVQYFEGGLLMADADGEVRLAPLAKEIAASLGIETKRVPRGDLPLFSEDLFATAPNPNPRGDQDAPGIKRVEVSISQQRLRAFQGDELVLETPVSTGLAPNLTEQGRFHVWLKFVTEDMYGTTGADGSVTGVGPDATGGSRYVVEDVPNVLYVNTDLEAMHGAYWHNNFGYPMSHGCINLPLDVADWMFGWAPIGTQVVVGE